MDDVSDSLLGAADESRGSTPIFIPIALALIGVALGGAALYISLSGGSEDELRASLNESGSQVVQLEKRVTELSAQNEKLRHDLEVVRDDSSKQVRGLASQMQNALNQVGQEILNVRGKISDNTQAVSQVVEALNSGQARPRSSAAPRPTLSDSSTNASAAAPTAAEPVDAASGYRTHVIASGETFASIATKYGVPLQKILEANPEANPRRLRIGQKIQVPVSGDE